MMTPSYPDTDLYIAGHWQNGGKERIPVFDPATGHIIGKVACADTGDVERAVAAAVAGFSIWRKTSAFDRARMMKRAALLLLERIEDIAPVLTLEQGKPLAQARNEINSAVEIIDWIAEEATRAYGRIIPARDDDTIQDVIREPVGPVAAFTPWNFPINQTVLKFAAAVAAGCSIIVKGPEDTPASCAALIRAFADAGLPDGVVGLLYGVPSEISEHLIADPAIRKISFTGSTSVGKTLAAMAGLHMKRMTMELGGHAPVLIFEDANIEDAARVMARSKYYNAGQVCISPTRFLIQSKVFDRFVAEFEQHVRAIKVGNGLDETVTMGPLANDRRLTAMEALLSDARQQGVTVLHGGERLGNIGTYFAPTILVDADRKAKANVEEPFGPLALLSRFETYEQAVSEANRLPFGLAAYAFTRSARIMNGLTHDVETGMLSINHNGLALAETPFGGIKDSGYGTEGGSEALDAYMTPKFVTRRLV